MLFFRTANLLIWPCFHSYTFYLSFSKYPLIILEFLELKISGGSQIRAPLRKFFLWISWPKILYQNCFLRAALNWIIYRKMWKYTVLGEFNIKYHFQYYISVLNQLCEIFFSCNYYWSRWYHKHRICNWLVNENKVWSSYFLSKVLFPRL